jgi:hypothetical protein
MKIFKAAVGSLALLLFSLSQTQGDVVTPVAEEHSSEFAPALNLINGSGLSGIGNVPDQLHDNIELNMWQTFATTSVGENVTFELDQNYDLSSAYIWQYNGPDGFGTPTPFREVNEFELAVSSDLLGGFSSIGTFSLAPSQDQTVNDFNEPAQTFALTGADNVRRVQLTILSVQQPPDDGFAGLSEVRFEGTVVPEPASVLALLMGIAMLGSYFRWRR